MREKGTKKSSRLFSKANHEDDENQSGQKFFDRRDEKIISPIKGKFKQLDSGSLS